MYRRRLPRRTVFLKFKEKTQVGRTEKDVSSRYWKTSRREERAGRKSKRKDSGKKEETADFYSIERSIKRKGCEKRNSLKISDAEATFPVPVIEEVLL
jgi:hypothetical protein